jgi:outer membrane receptor protein involved in Fe transport
MKRLALLLAAATLGWAEPSPAQEVGAIRGVVTDPSASAVPNVTVTVTEMSTGSSRTVRTAEDGGFLVDGLTPGTYTVAVAAPGLQSQSRRITVVAGTSARADFALTLSGFEEQIQVSSASRYERPLTDVPVSATVLTRDEILSTPGRSIDESLRNVASVQLQPDAADVVFPLNPSIAMRGLGVGDTATRSLVLVDGLPLNGGFFGQVVWNRVAKETIDRAEVVRGASSSLFGSFAEGGVVDIVTRVPAGPEAIGYVQYGENNRFQGDVVVGDTFADGRIGVGLNAQYYTTDGFYRVPEDEIRPIDEKLAASSINFNGNVAFQFSDTARGFVRGGYNDQDRDGQYRLSESNSKIGNAAAGLDFDLTPSQQLSFRGFWADEAYRVRNVTIVSDEETFVANPHHTTSTDTGASGQWTMNGTGVLAALTGGVDFRRVDGVDDQLVINEPGGPATSIVGGGTQTSIGVFGQASVKPVERLEILAGLRFDHFDNSQGRIVVDGEADDFEDRTFDFASPRVAVRYALTDWVAIRGAGFRGFRAPTLAELYRGFESPTFRGLPNPFLREESVVGGDLGFDFQRGPFTAQVNGFYNHMDDFVGSAEVGFENGKFTVINANIPGTRSVGAELVASMRFSPQWTFTVNYAYTDSVVTEGDLAGNQMEGAPKNAVSGVLNWSPIPAILVAPGVRYVSSSYQDITNEALQDARTIVDLYASWQLERHVAIIFLAENMFDEQYIADGFSASLGAPRQVSGAVRVTF